MEANQVLKILKFIKGAYGNRFEVNDNTALVWQDVLKDIPFEPVDEYVRGCAMEQDYPPSLADLKRCAGETKSQRFHQMLKDSAEERVENLHIWAQQSEPPPPGNREKVIELVNRKRPSTEH